MCCFVLFDGTSHLCCYLVIPLTSSLLSALIPGSHLKSSRMHAIRQNDAAKASVPKLFCCPGAPVHPLGVWLLRPLNRFFNLQHRRLAPPSALSTAASASRLPRSPTTYHIIRLPEGLWPREAQNCFRQPDLATNHGREAGCSGGLINLLFSPMPRVQGGARASAQPISLAGAGWEPA